MNSLGSFDLPLPLFLLAPRPSARAAAHTRVSSLQGVPITETAIGTIIEALEANFPDAGIRLDSAAVPNPFFGVSSKTFVDSDQKILNLVDGGEDGEVTPFQPLLVKARGVDTIIAIDAVRI